MMRAVTVSVCLAITAGVAHADHEVRIGMISGGMEVGGVENATLGPAFGVGRATGRWFLHLQADVAMADEDDRPGGLWIGRLHAGARRELRRKGRMTSAGWAGWTVWAGARGGAQQVWRDAGTVMTRPEVGLELGYFFGFRGAPIGVVGVDAGLALTFAPAPDPRMLPPCGDDCARSGGQDVGVLFIGSMAYGR